VYFLSNRGKYFVVTAHTSIRTVAILFGPFRQFRTQKRTELLLPNTIMTAIPKFFDKNLDSTFHTQTMEEEISYLSV
jgi:hypothetical protein